MNIAREKFARFDMNGALYIRDLPPEVRPNIRYTIGGASGELYHFTASRSHVTIYPTISGWTKLMGFVNKPDEIGFHLNTHSDPNEKPTHDLHAGIFYDAFLFYLLANSVQVTTIRDEWYRGTTNHSQFVNSLASKKSIEQAAYSTWSGKKALSHGFGRMKPISSMNQQQAKYGLLFMR